jgi:hypothetical protein
MEVGNPEFHKIMTMYTGLVETIYSHGVENADAAKRLIPVYLVSKLLTIGKRTSQTPRRSPTPSNHRSPRKSNNLPNRRKHIHSKRNGSRHRSGTVQIPIATHILEFMEHISNYPLNSIHIASPITISLLCTPCTAVSI